MNTTNVSFADYYNEHSDYKELRQKGSVFEKQYLDEVDFWKNKYLCELTAQLDIQSICEIGCAVGILLNRYKAVAPMHNRWGVDVSSQNIEYARKQFPDMNFFAGTFDAFLAQENKPDSVDLVILSDILEHVEDDRGLLEDAGKYGDYVVLNLPLEKCGEYEGRVYGLEDKHGHLRWYDVNDARQLVSDAGMVEVASIVRHYVQEPIFRNYLANKLFADKTGQDKVDGLAKYITEINEIDLNPSFYKSNYFGLLKRK